MVQPNTNDQGLLDEIASQPPFGVFRDTFIVTGPPLNTGANRSNFDALVQFSFRQRLINSRLPFNFFLFFSYTQKSFWKPYESSSPFRSHMYNPALGIGKYLTSKGKLWGMLFIQAEHESNGRKGKESRSWNFISFTGKYIFNPRLSLTLRTWLPWVDGKQNKDLLDYRGLATISMDMKSRDDMWWWTAEITPRKGFLSMNTTLTMGYKISQRFNQYLFARFFNGRSEDLNYHRKYDINFRVGICIKPKFFTVYY